MVKETKAEFEIDEEKAMKDAFEEAKSKGKLFNVISWKMKREKQRAELNSSDSN